MNIQGTHFKTGLIARTRRNHALEHATLQVIAQKHPDLKLGGYSDPRGFWVIGPVATQDLQLAVDEALARLHNGERQLAIHPNCGTNVAVSGLFAGLAAWVGLLGANDNRRRWDRLPLVVSLVTLSLILTRPLGPLVQQQVTTDAVTNGLQVMAIYYNERSELPAHRVLIRQ